MLNKEEEKNSVLSMLENRDLTEKELLSKVASIHGKKRWEGKTKEQRSEHMKMMRKHRRSYPQFRKKSIDPTNS